MMMMYRATHWFGAGPKGDKKSNTGEFSKEVPGTFAYSRLLEGVLLCGIGMGEEMSGRATGSLDSRCFGDFEGKMLCYIVFTMWIVKSGVSLGYGKTKAHYSIFQSYWKVS